MALPIKQQIFRLYLLELFGSFSLTDGVWIIFLLQRGFSLVEVGLAETVFHIASFLFELPSGAIADLFGRKKAMIASSLSMILSCVLMIAAWNLPLLCLAMVFTAFSYNLNSGTRDALTYDSLKADGKEDRFLAVNANQRFLYSVSASLSKLSTGLAGRIGYVWSYCCNILFSGVGIVLIDGMKEPQVTQAQKNRPKFSCATLLQDLGRQLAESGRFLRRRPDTAVKMLLDAMIGCGGTLTVFFLQQHFSANGVSLGQIGVFLLIAELGGMVGTRCAAWLGKRLPFSTLAMACAFLSCAGVMLTGSSRSLLAVTGAFFLRLFSVLLETITSEKVNRELPSDQRATLISVGSILFSVIMILFTSPLSILCSALGTGRAFFVFGGLLGAASMGFGIFGRKLLQ